MNATLVGFAIGFVAGAVMAAWFIRWRTAHALQVLTACVAANVRLLENDLRHDEKRHAKEEQRCPMLN